MDGPQWMDLVMTIPDDQQLTSQQIRKILAKQNAMADKNRQVDSAIFHYDNAGETLNSPFPQFRISGGGGIARIYAVGEDAVDYLAGNGHKLCRFMSQHCKKPVVEHRYTGMYTLHDSKYLQKYRIKSMVFWKNSNGYERLKEAIMKGEQPPEITEKIESLIREGLHLHAEAIGCSITPDFALGDIELDSYMPIAINKTGTRFVMSAQNVTFRCALNIKQGPIHVGYSKAKGYGLIQRG